jgi:hypothetical protein
LLAVLSETFENLGTKTSKRNLVAGEQTNQLVARIFPGAVSNIPAIMAPVLFICRTGPWRSNDKPQNAGESN